MNEEVHSRGAEASWIIGTNVNISWLRGTATSETLITFSSCSSTYSSLKEDPLAITKWRGSAPLIIGNVLRNLLLDISRDHPKPKQENSENWLCFFSQRKEVNYIPLNKGHTGQQEFPSEEGWAGGWRGTARHRSATQRRVSSVRVGFSAVSGCWAKAGEFT